jgi:hypothetical protein
MRTFALVLVLGACGETAAPAPPSAPQPPTATPVASAPSVPLAEVRGRSSCAFESIDALCTGLREHYGSSDDAWVSDGCAQGPRRTSSGAFAEALLLAIHEGSGPPTEERVERPLLGGTVREPPSEESTAHVVLAARLGEAWFPIHLFHPIHGDVDPDALEWSVDDGGASLTWTDEEAGSRRDDPYGYGRVERRIAVADHGVPILAASETIETWRSDVGLDCTRACNAEPTPPPYPGCERRCASRVRATRTWERVGNEIRIGATAVERAGPAADAMDVTSEAAEVVRLEDADPQMRFCAFVPRPRALPRASPRTDPESTALLERARARIAAGSARELRGALATARRDEPRSIVAIDGQMGMACGGGGCTVALRYRTLEGALPEEGVHYFVAERGTRVGCDDDLFPEPGEPPTLVEVAPATSRDAIGCGFGGWDGTAERHWVIVRVME